jgi:hypothetical protein
MKQIMKWFIMGLIVIVLPVVLWNVWFLDYIDTHGKLIPWLCAPVIALIGTGIFLGLNDAEKKPVIKGQINPFWGWFAGCLVINVVIVALSNT